MEKIAEALDVSKNTIHHDLANCSTVEQLKPAKTASNPEGCSVTASCLARRVDDLDPRRRHSSCCRSEIR
jgi:hypothetical protein